MALSHTPIPHDPGYENSHSFRPHTDPLSRYIIKYPKNVIKISTYIVIPNRGNGRIRPEAADIAMMHKRGTVGHLLTNPLLPPKHLKCTYVKV